MARSCPAAERGKPAYVCRFASFGCGTRPSHAAQVVVVRPLRRSRRSCNDRLPPHRLPHLAYSHGRGASDEVMTTADHKVERAADKLQAAVKEVAERASSVVRLELELAAMELRRKIVALGFGVGFAIGAAVFLLFALGFAFATVA